MPLQYNPDGLFDVYVQSSSPSADKEANWPSAPAKGPYNLTVRILWPVETVIDGSYQLPPVKKVQ